MPKAKTTASEKSRASARKSTSTSARSRSRKTEVVVEAEVAEGSKQPRATLTRRTTSKRVPKTANAGGREIPIETLWQEYKHSGTKELRNCLIEYYLDIVRYTAERMHMRLPGEVDVEDLMSAGLFGLMDAIDAFDLERGVKFETYCAQRIRGAIFDELRAMDWVPRLVRSRTAKVDRARKALEMELGRKPTDDEICQRLKVDNSEFQKLSKDSKPVGVVSLNRKWFETDSSKDIREIDVIRDKRQENPLSEIQLLITKGLSRAERLIVVLYYYEEMTMKEIGMTLDLSESRVSQMHSSILARLKAQMQHRAKEF
jgi:RNA polymerase sigma factor for flagellar operon FliA